MKRVIALIICAVMVLSLCSCAGVELPEPTSEPTAESAPAPAETPEPSEEPAAEEAVFETGERVFINVEKTELTELAPDGSGKLILTFSYETPVVYVEGNEEVSSMINDAIAMEDERYYSGYNTDNGYEAGYNAMLEAAIDNFTYAYNTGKDIKVDFSKVRKVDITRNDSVLSIVYKETTYTGDPKEDISVSAMNFDIATGELITLEKLIPDMDAFKNNVSDFIVEWMPDLASAVGVETYTDVILNSITDGNWFFNDGLIVFAADFSGIGEGAFDGVHYFTLFDSFLDENINPVYLPRQGGVSGTIEAYSQQSYGGEMEIIDRVVIDEGGQTVYLVVKGTEIDLQIYDVEYANDSFYATGLRWACSYVTDGVIQLVCNIPNGMPKLAINNKYSGEDDSNMLFLTSDGAGGVSLADDSISAVG